MSKKGKKKGGKKGGNESLMTVRR